MNTYKEVLVKFQNVSVFADNQKKHSFKFKILNVKFVHVIKYVKMRVFSPDV